MLAGALVFGASPATWASELAGSEDDTGYYVVNEATGERFEVADLIPETPAPAPGTITPQLIDTPTAYAACFGVGTPQFPDFPLRSYGWVPQATGTVYLQCGPITTKTYGWHHIQNQHQNDWQTRVNQGGIPWTWDDLMETAVRATLDWPVRYTVEYGGKRCYTAPVQVYNRQGQVVLDYNPTVIVSMTNNRVITAYPTSSQDCSRQAAWAF